MKEIRFIDMVILGLLLMGLIFPAIFYTDVLKSSSIIATTERIYEAEKIIEWQNKQNLKQANIIKNQRVFAKRALIIINRAVMVDSLSAALAKKYGWLKKGENNGKQN